MWSMAMPQSRRREMKELSRAVSMEIEMEASPILNLQGCVGGGRREPGRFQAGQELLFFHPIGLETPDAAPGADELLKSR